jgi:hypothetical protein
MRPSLNGLDCLTSAHHFEGALPSTRTEGARWILRRGRRNAARRDKRSVRRSRWRAVPVEPGPPLFARWSVPLSPAHAVAVIESVVLLLVGQDRVGGTSDSRLVLKRHGFLAASSHNAPKLRAVVGKDGERVSRSTDRNVELFAIDEFRRESGVDINDDAVDRGALSRMGSRGVAMIDVTEAIERRA